MFDHDADDDWISIHCGDNDSHAAAGSATAKPSGKKSAAGAVSVSSKKLTPSGAIPPQNSRRPSNIQSRAMTSVISAHSSTTSPSANNFPISRYTPQMPMQMPTQMQMPLYPQTIQTVGLPMQTAMPATQGQHRYAPWAEYAQWATPSVSALPTAYIGQSQTPIMDNPLSQAVSQAVSTAMHGYHGYQSCAVDFLIYI